MVIFGSSCVPGCNIYPPGPRTRARDGIQSGTVSGRRSPLPPVRSHPLKPERRVPLRRDLGDLGLLKTTANTARGGQESQSLPEPRKAS